MSKHKLTILVLLILPLILLTSGCDSLSSQETPTPETDSLLEEDFTPVINATGKIIPDQMATLSVQTGGIVADVLVKEGDQVEEGQVLVRLEGKEQLQAAISAAQLELENAKYALNQLYDDTDLLAAQALKAQDDAEKALEDLLNPELQEALALQAIADAQKAIDTTDRRLRTLQSTADQADIDAAKAQVVLARDKLDKAEDDYEPYADKPENNLVRANYLARLSAAQKEYDAAVRKLNALEGTGREVDIAVAAADLATAQAQLIEAERDWEEVKEGPNQADVALLEAQIDAAQRDYETYSVGPDPDDVAIATARIENAEEQLAAAQAALEDLELAAPFSGTVSDLYIHTSEWVAPGQPVLLIADLAHLKVETTDLNEIDVAQLVLGDTAIVSFDALPEAVVKGTVTWISPKSSEGSGVNYPVTIELNEIPSQLRWGMTAFVDIEIEK
jgi:multidrug efflux pump subunit AcrA (membrane-fusion protein)